MESKIGMVFRVRGDNNKNNTNSVHYYYKVIGDGFCEKIAYRRCKYMPYKNPKIFKFTSRQDGHHNDGTTEIWTPTYWYDVNDDEVAISYFSGNKVSGSEFSPYTSRSGDVTYM